MPQKLLTQRTEIPVSDILDKIRSHLEQREGVVFVVYKDTLGKPTGGIGHLLTEQEKLRYPIGSKISPAVVQNWFEKDTKNAVTLANNWVSEFGFEDDEAVVIFTSVAFQLGDFKKKFPNTFKAIKDGKYNEAIMNIKSSLWYKQTPVRARDLIEYIKTKT